jgi:hypothetical protein
MTNAPEPGDRPLDPDTIVSLLLQDHAEIRETLEIVELRLTLLETRDSVDVTPSAAAAGSADPLDGARSPWSRVDHDARGAPSELSIWVEWLTRRYALDDTIPACWAQHGPLIEELAALAGAWHDANTGPAASGTLALTWHAAFDACLTRIRAWDRQGCASADAHQPDLPPLTPHGSRPDLA